MRCRCFTSWVLLVTSLLLVPAFAADTTTPAPAPAAQDAQPSTDKTTDADKSASDNAAPSDKSVVADATKASDDKKSADTGTTAAPASSTPAKSDNKKKADPDQPDAIDNAAQDATAVITGKEKPQDLIEKYKLRFILWVHRFVPEFIQALIIFTAGYFLAKVLRILFLRFSRLREWDEAISDYFGLVIYISIIVVFTISALKALGFPVTSMLASFGISGVIIGLGVRAQLNNYFAGVAMLAARPFQKGDLVEFGPPLQIGIVKHVNMTNTVFDTLDKVRLVVPNGVVWRGYIKNYSRNSERIIRFDLTIAKGLELAWVRDLAAQVLTANEHVMQDPPPLLDVAEVTPDGIRAVLKAQCKVEAVQIFTQLVEDLRTAFEEAGLDVKLPAKGVKLKVEE